MIFHKKNYATVACKMVVVFPKLKCLTGKCGEILTKISNFVIKNLKNRVRKSRNATCHERVEFVGLAQR